MFFNLTLSISVLIFLFGVFYRVRLWFCLTLADDAEAHTPTQKFSSVAKGVCHIVFSRNILTLFKVILLDIVFQLRTLKESPYRWAMHILIYYGFILLLLMHGLEPVIAEAYLPDYYSTLNPYLFLRDFAGFMVIAGILMAMIRRFLIRPARLQNSSTDIYAVAVIAIVILSGILLEGFKISSYSDFNRMEQQYASLDNEAEINALASYWIQNFGVVNPNLKPPFSKEILSQGEAIHEENCMACHASPLWAFTGYSAAKITAPLVSSVSGTDFATIFWYVHFLAAFVGLAYLPFSKMFHIVVSPISLLANAVMDPETSRPQNFAVKQIMELDACTHCGACTTRCSVGIVLEAIPNLHILPSEKISALKKLAVKNQLEQRDIHLLQEGLYLCTNCHRCTDVCPAGINLQQLWHTVREVLLRQKHPEMLILSPLSLYRGLLSEKMTADQYLGPIKRVAEFVKTSYPTDIEDQTLRPDMADPGLRMRLVMSHQSRSFSCCYGCMTCTDACPVMHNYENPQKELDLVPHQIMQCLHLGYMGMVLGSEMLWACLGCYQCQDHCPQGVHVTDVFYELKNIAVKQATANAMKL